MKKVAILTLNGYFNYGNRLQNYALQEVIKNFGFEVETIINDTEYSNEKNSNNNGLLNKIKKLRERSIIGLCKVFYIRIGNFLYQDKLRQQRKQIFKDFSISYITETDYKISKDKIPSDISDRYDYFVTGSDQVWNPYYRFGSSIDFLTFAPKHKRIAYSPSFGIEEIPKEYVENYQIWLSEMHRLSVREEAGAQIIKDLTGRDAPVLIDPTLMLTKEEWLSISEVPSNKPKEGYLLTYFLGAIPKERKKLIKDVAESYNLKVVNLAKINDRVPYLSGPSEFIDYIHSAKIFLTDSFHGAVFSILLETPFFVFNRHGNIPSMNSRIKTLLSKFQLESRFAENINIHDDIFNIDYSHVGPILKAERKKSYEFLREALDIQTR